MIIAVEGNVYVGKTTLVHQLSRVLGLTAVAEQTSYLAEPPRQDLSWSEEHRRYVMAEKKRAESVSGSQVLDRSFLSLAAHATILYRLGKADIRDEFLEDLRRLQAEGRILVPDRLIWVRCPHGLAIRRHRRDASRGTSPLFLEKRYYRLHNQWFQRLQTAVPLFEVDSSNRLRLHRIARFMAGMQPIEARIWPSLMQSMLMGRS